jgi:hypothetical protein
VGFESSQWLSITRRRSFGQALTDRNQRPGDGVIVALAWGEQSASQRAPAGEPRRRRALDKAQMALDLDDSAQ